MRRPPRDGLGARPSVLDAMTLLVVAAVGLWLGRLTLELRYGTVDPGGWKAVEVLARWVLMALAAFLAVPLIGRGRPDRRRIGHHAGTAVVVANLLGVGFAASFHLPRIADQLRPGGWLGSRSLLGLCLVCITDPGVIAPSVAAAWVSLIVLDRPRWAFDWLDRLGRLVGVGWIALFVARIIVFLAD